MEWAAFQQVIVLESASQGVSLTDVWSSAAPWRTDDSLLSPADWPLVCRYPLLMTALRDCSTGGQKDTEGLQAFSRFSISLLSVLGQRGSVHDTLWQRFERVCVRQPNLRV